MTPDHLAPHFTLAELLVTNQPVDNSPTAADMTRLVRLAWDFLEPLRAQFGPIKVTSGYRSRALQERLRQLGRPTANDSAHCYGCAADLVPLAAGVTLDQMVGWLVQSPLAFDQVIVECDGDGNRWVHLGMLRPSHEAAPRRQALRYDHARVSPTCNGYSVWAAA